MKLFFCWALLCIVSFTSTAQNISIKRILLNGNNITVVYDLDDSNPTHEYIINLHSSIDDFKTPLSKVTGDAGTEIKPGSGKRITWNIVEEYGSYSGDVWLEIRGRVFVPFVKLQSFGEGRETFKRGNAYDLKWRPGNTNPIHIELFRGNDRMQGELNLPNNGSHRFGMTSKLKPGSNYRLKITDSRKSDDVFFTENFKVKRKFPLLIKLLPLAGLAAVIPLLDFGGGGSNNIEDPPGVPPEGN